MFQVRRFRVVQPTTALASINDGILKKRWGGQA